MWQAIASNGYVTVFGYGDTQAEALRNMDKNLYKNMRKGIAPRSVYEITVQPIAIPVAE